MIEFDCPICNHHITAADSFAGKAKTCPKCNSQLTVPSATQAIVNALSKTASPITTIASSQVGTENARIPCPICGELIPSQAKRCHFCDALLVTDSHADERSSSVNVLYTKGMNNSEFMRIKNYICEFWSTKFYAFEGRASRREYWYLTLFEVVCEIVLCILSATFGNIIEIINSIYGYAVLIPSTALLCRRCHDVNIPSVVGIVLSLLIFPIYDIIDVGDGDVNVLSMETRFLLFIMVLSGIGEIIIGLLPGIKGANQYGADPYENPNDKTQSSPMVAS